MSYDITLKDPITKETLELPVEHIMIGGTYKAKYDEHTNTFSPMPTSEAWLNITYNYADYYYEATENDKRFEIIYEGKVENGGIRGLYGKTGAESISMLKDMIKRIEDKYKINGEWITTKRKERIFYDISGKEIDFIKAILEQIPHTIKERVIEVSEGDNNDYWQPTAINAIKPLHQLIAFASLRPDGVWDGD